MTDTNWIIVTGEPRSGKSTLIEQIAFKGHRICPEASRILMDEQRSRNEKPDYYTECFEKKIAEERIAAEERFRSDEYVFWDRSLVDSIAFSRLYGRGMEEMVRNNLKYHYRHVFYLCELSSYQPDYATLETKEKAKILGRILLEVYKELGYSPIIVPQMDIKSRLDFIFDMVWMR